MSSSQKVRKLLDCMHDIAKAGEYSEKEILFCKELYSEIQVCNLGYTPKTDREKALIKSGVKISDKDAMFSIKIRIKNLIESEL